MDQPVFDAICDAISEGTLVQDACKANGISRETLNTWSKDSPAALDAYARARVQQCHAFAEECISIADGTDEEAQTRQQAMVSALQFTDDKDKDHVLNSLQNSAVQRDRLRLDARKWFTSKIAPKIFGDKLDVTSDGKAIGLEAIIAGSMGKSSTSGE